MSANDPILQELFDACLALKGVGTPRARTEGIARVLAAVGAFGDQSSQRTAPAFGLYLDLSTAHVTRETRNLLDLSDPGCWPIPGHKGEYGWFLFAPEDETLDEEDCEVPADLAQVARYVRACGVTHFLLDADASIDPHLPTYAD